MIIKTTLGEAINLDSVQRLTWDYDQETKTVAVWAYFKSDACTLLHRDETVDRWCALRIWEHIVQELGKDTGLVDIGDIVAEVTLAYKDDKKCGL